MIFTFEGLPYSGRSTQINNVQDLLNKKARVLKFTEPGWNNETSLVLKSLIEAPQFTDTEKLFLYLADRAGLYQRNLTRLYREAKMMGDTVPPIVLAKNGPDSTVAYQGFGKNIAPIQFLVEANNITTRGVMPTKTFYMDVSVDTVESRMDESGLELKPEQRKFLEDVRAGFLKICEVEERVVYIDAEQKENEVLEKLSVHLREVLGSVL